MLDNTTKSGINSPGKILYQPCNGSHQTNNDHGSTNYDLIATTFVHFMLAMMNFHLAKRFCPLIHLYTHLNTHHLQATTAAIYLTAIRFYMGWDNYLRHKRQMPPFFKIAFGNRFLLIVYLF
jgi:hypothetical protein